MGGNSEAAPTTVSGATNHFTMELDYAAMSFGTQDEVFNRMQPINFYWELLDVTGKYDRGEEGDREEGEGRQRREGRTRRRRRTEPRSGDGHHRRRRTGRPGDDGEGNWGWDQRAAYLALIGVSNAIRTVGALVSSYVDLVTEPLNERAIGMRATGEYLIRGVATPQASDAAREDPANHVIRASSIAALPVKVIDINARAKGSLDEEGTQLAKLRRTGRCEGRRRRSRRRPGSMPRRVTKMGGLATYQSSLKGLRNRLELLEASRTSTRANRPSRPRTCRARRRPSPMRSRSAGAMSICSSNRTSSNWRPRGRALRATTGRLASAQASMSNGS